MAVAGAVVAAAVAGRQVEAVGVVAAVEPERPGQVVLERPVQPSG